MQLVEVAMAYQEAVCCVSKGYDDGAINTEFGIITSAGTNFTYRRTIFIGNIKDF